MQKLNQKETKYCKMIKKIIILILIITIFPYQAKETICKGSTNKSRIDIEEVIIRGNKLNLNINMGRNNPGNLRSFKTGKFRKFKSMKEGYDALIWDLERKISGKSNYTDSTTTIYKFVRIYAPKHENDVVRYTKVVCEELGVSKYEKLHNIKPHMLAKAIIKVEDYDLYKLIYKIK